MAREHQIAGGQPSSSSSYRPPLARTHSSAAQGLPPHGHAGGYGFASKLAQMSKMHSYASSSAIDADAFTVRGEDVSTGCAASNAYQEEEGAIAAGAAGDSPVRAAGRDKLPVRIMSVLCIVIFCEPVAMTILCGFNDNFWQFPTLPFVYFMVRDFGLADDREIGFYVGFIASSFSLAQFATSMLWGWVSDRVGRRPVLLVGLLGNAVTLLMFGQAHSLQMAILSRMLSGTLNGNIGIAKCVIGEITTPQTQAFGFSLIGIMWSLGTVVGPVLGGCLAYPVQTRAGWVPAWAAPFLARSPFFLPCAVGAAVSLLGLAVGFVFLDETRPPRAAAAAAAAGYVPVRADEPPDARDSLATLDGASAPPCLVRADNNGADCRLSSVQQEEQARGVSSIAKQAIIAYSLLAFQNIVLDEVFSLWIVTPPADGGLGYDSAQVGIIMSIIGMIAFYMQLFIYPYLTRFYSPTTLYRIGTALYIFPYITYPALSGMVNPRTDNKTLVWLLLLANLALRQFCNVLTYTSVFILINNGATRAALGLVNGIAQTSAAFVRSIGPALGGVLWAWSITNGRAFPCNFWFVFLAVAAWALVTAAHSTFVVDGLDGADCARGGSEDVVLVGH